MKWLKSYCRFLFARPWNELKRSKWYLVFIVLPTISTVLTFVGLFLNLRIPLPDWSNQTWLILFLLSIISTLLLLIEGLRRYDVRTTNEAREEWKRRTKALRVLNEFIAIGQELYGRCKSPNYESDKNLLKDIDNWQRGAASAIVFQGDMHESYRDMFYKDSDTGRETPPIDKCLSWLNTRIVILEKFRHEFEQPLDQISEDSNIQIVVKKPQLRG